MARCAGEGAQVNRIHADLNAGVRAHVFLAADPAGPIVKNSRKIQHEERGLAGDVSRPGDITVANPNAPLQLKLLMDGTTVS